MHSGQQQPALTPGFAGLIEAGNDPLKQLLWQKQTLDWLVKDWVGGTIVSGLMGLVLPNVLDSFGLGGLTALRQCVWGESPSRILCKSEVV
ncbi:hypothetical protein MHOL44478_21045 [Mycobacterium holsaticum DSM 44478]|nr:hypothetical protein [Mycolicibacterium holsaticum DSM 44478 = JCM 12374]